MTSEFTGSSAAANDAAGANAHGLARVLGLFDATCIVIGAIIGVGIFFTPSNVARLAGSGQLALAAWIVGGVIALAGALSFAALGSVFHTAGGQYAILRDSYGRFPAFLYVFCNATGIQAGAIAIIACICAQNVGVAVAGNELTGTGMLVLASVLVVGLVGANILGVKLGAGIQNFTVLAKVTTLIVIGVLAATTPAFQQVTGAAVATGPSSAGGIFVALFSAIAVSFFAYGGWQHALWMAGEVRNPRRNIPLAILIGVGIVIVVYVGAAWAYLSLLGYEGVTSSKTLAADAVATAWPVFGRRLISGAVAVSAFGVLNAQLLSGPRLVYRMALERQFFAPFGRIAAATGTPAAAISLLGACGLLLLWAAGAKSDDAISTIDKLITGVVVVDGVFFALTAGAIFILSRRSEGAGLRRIELGFPIAPAIFILGEGGLLVASNLNPETANAAKFGLAWIVAAAVFWLLFFRQDRVTDVS